MGNDERGMSWNRVLLGKDRTYLEIQSGLFESQQVYRFLKPQQEIRWQEFWYPVCGMETFKHAEKHIVLDYEIDDGGIEFSVMANKDYADCEMNLDVMQKNYEGKVLQKSYSKKIDLQTGVTQKIRFEFEAGFGIGSDNFRVQIKSDDSILLSFGERDEYVGDDMNIDDYEDARSYKIEEEEQGRLLRYAEYKESLGELDTAEKYYIKNIENNPNCTVTLNRLGLIYLKSMRLDAAKECFKRFSDMKTDPQRPDFILLARKDKAAM
jgi:tetratricopeptide (TPR) repeat protein